VTYYRDRTGVLRWRFRKKGHPESQTREPFDSREWWAWYERARAAQMPPIGSSRTIPGTIDALAVAFYASAEWHMMRQTTRTTYKGILDRFRDGNGTGKRYGSLPVKELQPQHIRKVMDRMADRSAAANNLLKVLKAALNFAVSRNWRQDNPAAAVRPLKRVSEGFYTWSEEDIGRYEHRWPLGTKERLAFDLLLYTAQRSGDVRLMGPQHVTGDSVTVVQQKTGHRLELPIHPRLQKSLAAATTGHLTFLVAKTGSPYTAKGFSQWMSEAANQAGLPKQAAAHGLRKAAARRLAEAGCSANMIMSVTGHKSLKEVERYTRAAGQKLLAQSAMRSVGGT